MDSLGSLIKYIRDCDLQRVQKINKLGGLSVTHSGAAMTSTRLQKLQLLSLHSSGSVLTPFHCVTRINCTNYNILVANFETLCNFSKTFLEHIEWF